jgi:hypothetical protein
MIQARSPESFLPVSAKIQRNEIDRFVKDLSDEDLAWISENRDFSETERYTAKDEVDQSLTTSQDVVSECARIEHLFEQRDPTIAASEYLTLVQAQLVRLHDFHCSGIRDQFQDLSAWYQFWKQAATLADIDNAHAMYLSSGNWPFSVFNGVIEELSAMITDQGLLNILLTAGIQDARTTVYSNSDQAYRGLSRTEFATAIRKRFDWVREDGIMPLFTYKAATGNVSFTRPELTAPYAAAVKEILKQVSEDKGQRFVGVLSSYVALYAARAAYDIYEYFGMYAFLRHTLIRKTTTALKTYSEDLSREFHYAASTYQFNRALQALTNAGGKRS